MNRKISAFFLINTVVFMGVLFLSLLEKRYSHKESYFLYICWGIIVSFIVYTLYKRIVKRKRAKFLLETLKKDKTGKLTTESWHRYDSIRFTYNTDTVSYRFEMPDSKNCVRLQATFLLRKDFFTERWDDIVMQINQFIIEYPIYKNLINISKKEIMNDNFQCTLSLDSDKNLSKSNLLLIARFLRKIEEKHLISYENYINIYVLSKKVNYYVHYINGIAIDAYVENENGVWNVRHVLDNAYKTMGNLDKCIKSNKVNITYCVKDSFDKIKEKSICELD